ncbi:uncharacterized protein BDW43DRAFT_271554 [Aspergillus alliaceus]|uniref:uncharacterized protein n=1 Tax=Petromyces alliaceus TaxID=209559 RepID=UPI0012A6F143|nr:uncharacterized protein BDW43DRAFT_271554 [Aspergillus alliaceus]KAB8235304.1 hypothetical protein BDW43DRAFT_271554 [Aspergillus alliaceus]
MRRSERRFHLIFWFPVHILLFGWTMIDIHLVGRNELGKVRELFLDRSFRSDVCYICTGVGTQGTCCFIFFFLFGGFYFLFLLLFLFVI